MFSRFLASLPRSVAGDTHVVTSQEILSEPDLLACKHCSELARAFLRRPQWPEDRRRGIVDGFGFAADDASSFSDIVAQRNDLNAATATKRSLKVFRKNGRFITDSTGEDFAHVRWVPRYDARDDPPTGADETNDSLSFDVVLGTVLNRSDVRILDQMDRSCLEIPLPLRSGWNAAPDETKSPSTSRSLASKAKKGKKAPQQSSHNAATTGSTGGLSSGVPILPSTVFPGALVALRPVAPPACAYCGAHLRLHVTHLGLSPPSRFVVYVDPSRDTIGSLKSFVASLAGEDPAAAEEVRLWCRGKELAGSLAPPERLVSDLEWRSGEKLYVVSTRGTSSTSSALIPSATPLLAIRETLERGLPPGEDRLATGPTARDYRWWLGLEICSRSAARVIKTRLLEAYIKDREAAIKEDELLRDILEEEDRAAAAKTRKRAAKPPKEAAAPSPPPADASSSSSSSSEDETEIEPTLLKSNPKNLAKPSQAGTDSVEPVEKPEVPTPTRAKPVVVNLTPRPAKPPPSAPPEPPRTPLTNQPETPITKFTPNVSKPAPIATPSAPKPAPTAAPKPAPLAATPILRPKPESATSTVWGTPKIARESSETKPTVSRTETEAPPALESQAHVVGHSIPSNSTATPVSIALEPRETRLLDEPPAPLDPIESVPSQQSPVTSPTTAPLSSSLEESTPKHVEEEEEEEEEIFVVARTAPAVSSASRAPPPGLRYPAPASPLPSPPGLPFGATEQLAQAMLLFGNASAQPSPAAARFCPQCRLQLDASARFCQRCGTPLLAPSSSTMSMDPWSQPLPGFPPASPGLAYPAGLGGPAAGEPPKGSRLRTFAQLRSSPS